MQRRTWSRITLILIALLAVSIAASTAFAGSLAFSGTFDGDPTMTVVFISTPNCTGQGVQQVRYDAFPFTVTQTGAYNFSAASTGGAGTLASIYIMNSGFNPAAAFGNCIAASNSGSPTTLNGVNLTAGTQYYLVIFDDTFGQAVPGYNFSANGVGDIVLSDTSPACTNPLPSGSIVHNVPLGAPAYYDANFDTRLSFDLPAGNWYITQTSGEFAQIWIACQADSIWIPLTAVGG